ncbi:MAG: choice-of-anchor Q domain-containing protein, partial [Gemmataceae bacterium]
ATVANNRTIAGEGGGCTFGSAAGGVYDLAYGNTITSGSAQSAITKITDSILSNSIGGNDLVNNVVNGKNTNTAAVTLSGPNLVQTSTGSIGGTTPLTTDPQLGPLQNNGGPTPTMALTSSSPAYQAGILVSGITTDQRGDPRSITTPTLRAFEPQGTTPTLTVTDAGGVYNGNPFPATATAVGQDGKTPVADSFSYTYYVGTDTSGANLGATAPSNAGTYTVVAAFTSSDPNYTNGSAQTTFTINPASTTTTAGKVTITFSDSTQDVTLTANVSSNGVAVNEGNVSFTVLQGSTIVGTATTSDTVHNGAASVSYVLPGITAAGTYTLSTVYNPGPDFLGSSDSNASTVTIAQAAAAIQFTSVTVVPNFFALTQTETIAVHVSIPSGAISGGTIAFTVDGQNVSASVEGNGNAAASLTLPLLATAFPQSINAAYSGSNANGSSTTAAYWQLVDALLPSVDTFAADGGQSVQSYLFGMPLWDYLYNPQGQLTEVVLGSDLLNWVYSYTNTTIVVRLDNELPVSAAFYTPQGQYLGTVALTLSPDGTVEVEAINALGQVASSLPV